MKNLKPLFEAELSYSKSVGEIVPPQNREGDLIGNGNGTVKGERITGTIKWSFYSKDCAYLLVQEGKKPPDEGKHLCKTNPGGIITTEDGAEIKFNAKGYGLRGFDTNNPHLWVLTASLQFTTENDNYSWLNNKLAVWEGVFNEEENKSKYSAYLQEV